MKVVLNVFLTFATGGAWLIVLAVAALVKYIKDK